MNALAPLSFIRSAKLAGSSRQASVLHTRVLQKTNFPDSCKIRCVLAVEVITPKLDGEVTVLPGAFITGWFNALNACASISNTNVSWMGNCRVTDVSKSQ